MFWVSRRVFHLVVVLLLGLLFVFEEEEEAEEARSAGKGSVLQYRARR